MRSAVLFLVFNRPDTTRRVFEAIRAARPPRLYVAADGPRPGRDAEGALCAEARAIATAIDWPCGLQTLLREQNLGCKRAVSDAIGWFFEHETEGIVLEDDCLPDPSFFAYCDALLERYRDDERVMCISGDNFISALWQPASSYWFSRCVHIWGWATWRRAWRHYDVSMADWRNGGSADLLAKRFPGAPRQQEHWRQAFDAVSSGRLDTWDYQWVHACWRAGAYSCMPAHNLVTNIGFGAGATHTLDAESRLANLPPRPLPLPLRHPGRVEPVALADRWAARHVFGVRERLTTAERWREWLGRGQLRLARFGKPPQ